MTPRARPRSFGPVDAAVLAAALAPAIVVICLEPRVLEAALGLPEASVDPYAGQTALRQRWEWDRAYSGAGPWVADLRWLLGSVLLHGAPLLVLATPGFALAILQRPGIRLRRLCRGVGVRTAVITGGLVAVFLANDYVLRRLSQVLGGYGNSPFRALWRQTASPVAVAVLASWVVLAVARRWHPEPHWRDRLGRALGAAWIGYWLLRSILSPLVLGY